MDAKRQKYQWKSNRPKKIIIQDDTFNGDMIQWRLLVRFFFPKYQNRIILMVNPNDTIDTIKAYIQEEKGIAFKKQRLLSKDGEDLSDVESIESYSFLILRYAPVIAQLSVKMLLMSFIVKDPWLLSRTMEIIIHDDSHKDVIEFCSSPKSNDCRSSYTLMVKAPKSNDCRSSYTLMVGPEDTIAAVKAYIQEKLKYYFNRQKLFLNEGAKELSDNAQTLSSLGIKKGSALILRYGRVYKIIFTQPRDCVFIKPGDTAGDVRAAMQKEIGTSYAITCRGGTRLIEDHEPIFDPDIWS